MIKFLALILSVSAFAGTNNLPVETSRVIQRSHVNKFQEALGVDLVPRDIDGTVTDLGGQLGTTAYRWSLVDTKKLNLIQDAAGNAISIVSPAALASAYTFTLLSALPGVTSYITTSSAGIWDVVPEVRTNGTSVGLRGVAIASGSGDVAVTASSYGTVTNQSVTITTHGAPVKLELITYIGASPSFVQVPVSGTLTAAFFRGATQLTEVNAFDVAGAAMTLPPGFYTTVDVVAAGTYTYTFQAKVSSGTATFRYVKLVAYEL